MGKQKNTELNFLYMNEKYQGKETKKKKQTKKTVKDNKRAGKMSAQEDMKFNFDNEIVIGVTRVPEPNKKKKNNSEDLKSNKNTKKKTTTDNTKKTKKVTKKEKDKVKKTRNENLKNSQTHKKNTQKPTKKNRIIKGIVKWTILLTALVASFIYFMMSPLFNLASIEVINNQKISSDTIISLSELKIGENIYKTSSNKIEKNIKQNAYIESVKINRKLPNKIEITVKERKTTYMLEYANSYVYINNQGYILEISETKLEVPIIMGYITPQEEIKEGARLNSDDLERLETVLKIMESANSNEVGNLVTRINIQNKQNYVIILEGEKKTVYLGNASNLSNRMLYLKAILKEEKGIEGEIFINGDLNKSDVYFRRKE